MRIKEICKIKGITTEELAQKIGSNQPHISNIDTEKANPTLRMLKKIADALGVTVPELFAPQSESDFTALIDYKGELKRFNSLSELESFVAKIKD